MVEMEQEDGVVARRTRQQTRMQQRDGVSGRKKRKSVIRKVPGGVVEKARDLSGSRATLTVGRRTSARLARLRCGNADGGDDGNIALDRCVEKKIGMIRRGGRKRKSCGKYEPVFLGMGTADDGDPDVEDDRNLEKVTDEFEGESGVTPGFRAPSFVACRTRSQVRKLMLTYGVIKAAGNEPDGCILIDNTNGMEGEKDEENVMEEEKDEENVMKDDEDVDNSTSAEIGKDKRNEHELGQSLSVGKELVEMRCRFVSTVKNLPHRIRASRDEIFGKWRKLGNGSAEDDSTSTEEKTRDSSDCQEPSCVARRTRSQLVKLKCGIARTGDNSSENVIQIDEEDDEGHTEAEEEDDDVGHMIKSSKDKEDSVDGGSRQEKSKHDDSINYTPVDDEHDEDSEEVRLMSCHEKDNDDLKNKDILEIEKSVWKDEMVSASGEREKGETGAWDIVDFENTYDVRKMLFGRKLKMPAADVSSYLRESQSPMHVTHPIRSQNIKRRSDLTDAENNRSEGSSKIVDDSDAGDDDKEEVEKADVVKGYNTMKDFIRKDSSGGEYNEDDLIDVYVEDKSSGDEYDEEDLMDDSVQEESSVVEYDEDYLKEYNYVDGQGRDNSEGLVFSDNEENDSLSSDMENGFSVATSADMLSGQMPACIARRTRSHFKASRSKDGTFSNPCCLDIDEDDQKISLHDNDCSGLHKDFLGGNCKSSESNERKTTSASEGGVGCSDEDDQNIYSHNDDCIGLHKDFLDNNCKSSESNERKITSASDGGVGCCDGDDQNIALHDNNSRGMHQDLLVGKCRSFEFSKRNLTSASEAMVNCIQIPKSLGEEGRPPDKRFTKHPNDTRKIQQADSGRDNREQYRENSNGRSKRKHIRQANDARKVLLEAIWGQRDALRESNGIIISKVERITNWKFSFGEDSPPVEKSGTELEFDKLWMEFEFCLRACEIESGNTDMESSKIQVENGNVLQPRLDPCIWGSHDAILDEEIGLKCRHCSSILQEIRDIVAPFRKDPVERYVKRDFGSLDDDFSRMLPTEIKANDLNSGFPSAQDGTVWDLIPGIKYTLYPHQREGFEFIWKNIAGTVDLSEARRLKESNDGSGCIISHAPGTGKSRLAIVFLQAYLTFFPDCRPVIIAPKSMLLTWEDEFKKWNVDFPFHNVNNDELSGKEDTEALNILARLKHGSPRKEILRMVKLYSWKCQSSVLGISYTLFEKLTLGRATEEDEWSEGNVLLKLPAVLVLDEGHTPRNNDTLIWQALSSVRTQKRICLSGTPFQNNFDELFNTFCMARPGFASTMSHMNKGNGTKKRGPKPRAGKTNWANLTNSICENSVEDLENLKAMISPFVHVYAGNVLRDSLPGLSHKIIYLRPGSLQKSLLQSTDVIANIMERRHIASLISVHPSLLLQHSSAMIGELFCEVRELRGMQLTPQDGAKTKFLIDFLRLTEVLEEKVLVFSDYIDPLIFLKDQLKSFFGWTEGEEIQYMDGKLDVKQRQTSIGAFNEEGSNAKVLLASKKACCEGISLVGASRVVFLDAAWNPSVQRQAISRAYRLGQKKFVYVYHLITFGTIEEDVYRLQMRKERISNMVFPSAKGTDINGQQGSDEVPEDKVLMELLEHSTIMNLIEKVV